MKRVHELEQNISHPMSSLVSHSGKRDMRSLKESWDRGPRAAHSPADPH